jgi:hypothetical protein
MNPSSPVELVEIVPGSFKGKYWLIGRMEYVPVDILNVPSQSDVSPYTARIADEPTGNDWIFLTAVGDELSLEAGL